MQGQVAEQGFDLTTGDGVAALEAYVHHRLAGQLRDFRVVVTERGVILRGQAHTYYAKQLAQHAILEAIKLPIVTNEIEVA